MTSQDAQDATISGGLSYKGSRANGRTAGHGVLWILGAAVVAAVVLVAFRLAESEEFVALAERSETRWLPAAVVVIALAYGVTTEGAKRMFHRKVAME